MADETFYCQKCNHPLNIDESLKKISPVQLQLILNKNQNVKETKEENLDPLSFIQQDRLETYNEANELNKETKNVLSIITDDDEEGQNTNTSYVMLKEEEGPSNNDKVNENITNTISARSNQLSKVFEILSKNQDIDHPLCIDCFNLLHENYKNKFDQNQKEKESYIMFLKKLNEFNQNSLLDNGEQELKLSQSISNVQRLMTEEEQNLNELKQLEHKKSELETELLELKSKLNKLMKNDLTEILILKNKLQADLDIKLNKLEQAKSSYQVHLHHLDKIRELNIYTSFFDISFDKDDIYGTINGFRLGSKIIWSEVNAALGQIVLLLNFLLKRLKMNLKNYKLIPLGSQSQIVKYINNTNANGERNKSKTVLNLYSSNDFTLGKLFNFNKMDVSMIALLEIVSQIEDKFKSIDLEIEFPYAISPKNDSIGGKSIRITSSNEWTDSCKFLLTNLRWMLTYASVYT